MQFYHARKGIGQIFTAEILALIAGVLALVSAVMALTAIAASEAAASDATVGGLALGTGGIALVASILAIVSFILTIVGIHSAGKDEETFHKAMLWLILGIVGSVLTSTGAEGSFLAMVGTLLSTLGSMLSTLYVIQGVISLADRVGNAQVRRKGENVVKLILAVYIIVLILKIIDLVGAKSDFAVISGGVLGIAALVLSLVAYIIYLTLLSAGKMMLQN